jgi:hypothetical protein
VLDRGRTVVLRGSSACDRNQRFAGGIGDEVKMKEARIARRHRSGFIELLWMTKDKATSWGQQQETGRPALLLFPHGHSSALPETFLFLRG